MNDFSYRDWTSPLWKISCENGRSGESPNAPSMKKETSSSVWQLVDDAKILGINPWRSLPPSAHKYDRGHVLIIGGSSGKTGAPVLSGLAALRSGAGWVTLAIPRGKIPVDRPIPWELTIEDFFDGQTIDAHVLRSFIQSRNVRCIVLGPGWMHSHLDQFVWEVLGEASDAGVSLVFDGGALHGLLDLVSLRRFSVDAKVVATPHPGEWKKLSGLQSLESPLTPQGVEAVLATCLASGLCLVYKGSTPVVCSRDAAVVVMSGNNTLGRAGSGDVYAGITAAHLCQRGSASFAAARAYVVLALAAKKAADLNGIDGVLATDIIQEIGLINSTSTHP